MKRMRHRRYRQYALNTGCGVEACMEVLGGKWKGIIVHELLQSGTRRFGQLKALKRELSPRILTSQLQELEEDGVVSRQAFAEIPPRVEYSLTDFGRTLAPVVEALQTWGDGYLTRLADEGIVTLSPTTKKAE